MARIPDGFDYRAYCAEMERRIALGEKLVKASDGFYYYKVPAAIEAEHG